MFFLIPQNRGKCDTFSYVHPHTECGNVMSGRYVVLIPECLGPKMNLNTSGLFPIRKPPVVENMGGTRGGLSYWKTAAASRRYRKNLKKAYEIAFPIRKPPLLKIWGEQGGGFLTGGGFLIGNSPDMNLI